MEEGTSRSHGDHMKFLHLKSALLAMETSDRIVSLARTAGRGSLTEEVQSFILEILYSLAGNIWKLDGIYVKGILKKLITNAESKGEVVIDGAYERYARYMSSMQEYDSSELSRRVVKHITFLCPEVSDGSWPIANNFVVPLQCSLNILEGDTGCAIWPSSLFLSEFILSYPKLFCNRTCLEVGSGAGLVGIVLHKVNTSQVILSDGDRSSLMNLKFNLKLNGVGMETHEPNHALRNESPLSNQVWCKYLPWEEANETDLQVLQPNIVLGADIIYDPSRLPHLVRLLAILLCKKQPEQTKKEHGNRGNGDNTLDVRHNSLNGSAVAYIAGVIRNVRTFNAFLELLEEARLSAIDITDSNKPYCFLPYMLSYDRSCVRLYRVTTCN